jgi:hypothetical protein
VAAPAAVRLAGARDTVATPDAFVIAVPELGENTASSLLSVVNVTIAFATAPVLSVTVTVTIAGDPLEIVVMTCAALSVNARVNVGSVVASAVVSSSGEPLAQAT